MALVPTGTPKKQIFSALKLSGKFTYHQRRHTKPYTSTTQCIYVCLAILTTDSIKRLVFVKKTNCVYCQVEMLYNHLHKIHTRRMSLTAEARVRSLVGPCEIYGKVTPGAGFSYPSTSVFPCQCPRTSAPCSYSSWNYSYQKDKRAKPGNLRTKQDCSGSRKYAGQQSIFTSYP